MAVGLIITLDSEDPDAEFDALSARLKRVSTPGKYTLMREVDGYDPTNKAYLYPRSCVIWTTRCDGSETAFSHNDDGLDDPESLIDRITVANEKATARLTALCPKIGLTMGAIKVIRYTKNYE